MNTDTETVPAASVKSKQEDRSIGSAREETGRRSQTEGGSCHENREDPAATGAVIACGHWHREAGLPILRER